MPMGSVHNYKEPSAMHKKLLSIMLSAVCVLVVPVTGAANDPMGDLRQAVRTPTIEVGDNDDIGLWARFHFALHTGQFDVVKEFYNRLGFTHSIGGFPLSNTHAVARALGMFDQCQYLLSKGEVLLFPNAINTTGIDLLQFEVPYNPEPPYAALNHLGMAYSTLLTTDLIADYEYLLSSGVDFVSEPFGAAGNRFVFMRDPEGVFIKLEEQSLPLKSDTSASAESVGTHIVGMPYIGINVSNLEKSIEFYRLFGYSSIRPINEQQLSLEESRAWGFDRPVRYVGADISIARGDQHRLRLLQWLEPFDAQRAYAPPINHKGMNRLALTVPDVERAVDILSAQGVEFLSEIAPCCSGTAADETGIVHAIDPDGVFLELVGKIQPRPLAPQPDHCPPLTIKTR